MLHSAMLHREFHQLAAAATSIVLDRKNRRLYGEHAPRVAELIWLDPLDVTHYIRALPRTLSSRKSSGVVLDYRAANIEESPLLEQQQVRSCIEHWCHGVPWKDTEDYNYMIGALKRRGSVAGCRNEFDVQERFNHLDRLFEVTLKDGHFKTQKQLHHWNFREFGGVQICINDAKRPVLNKAGGIHRMAIAHIQKLRVIPASIGLVDKSAIEAMPMLRVFNAANTHFKAEISTNASVKSSVRLPDGSAV